MGKHLRIGLFGFGTVGHGLWSILHRTDSITAEIGRICVKHPGKERDLPRSWFTFDHGEILEDDAIDVVVEVIDDAEQAYDIVTDAMRRGKNVVSANKKMIAGHMEELISLQRETGTSLIYEAAACASIPVIRNLEEYYDNDLLRAFYGIVNGSSNYILSWMREQGVGYSEALARAQAEGFAESNPGLDVDGHDATDKLAILAAHAFGVVVKPEAILTYGIATVGEHDLGYAREKGQRIKLVASCTACSGGLAMWVMPRLVNAGSKLYGIEQEDNGVIVEGAFSDAQLLVGKGAGSYPTGSAVISDISALTYGYRYEYKKYCRDGRLGRREDIRIRIYLRYEDPGVVDEIGFETIEEEHRTPSAHYVVGIVPLQNLLEITDLRDRNVFLAQMD